MADSPKPMTLVISLNYKQAEIFIAERREHFKKLNVEWDNPRVITVDNIDGLKGLRRLGSKDRVLFAGQLEELMKELSILGWPGYQWG